MNANLFNTSLRSNCLGEYIDNEGNVVELYVQFNESTVTMDIGTLYIGSEMYPLFKIEYDNDFSLDWNLQNLLDPISEAGYSDINQ